MANITEYGNDTNRTDITSQSTLPASLGIFLSALNIFLSFTATLSNALILIALRKVSSIYPPTKFLFRCMALTDLWVGLILQPFYATFLMSLVQNRNKYVAILRVANFFTALLLELSVLTATAISVDRLLALLLGLRYRHVVSLRRVRVVIGCFWIISTVSGSMFFTGRTDIYSNIFLVLTTLSLVTTIFSYTKIFLTLRHHQAQLRDHVQERQPTNGGETPLNIARYKRTVSAVAWVQLALIICYAPFCTVELLVLYGKLSTNTALLITSYFTLSLVYLNSSLNPVLYCWKIKDVRQQVKKTIRQMCCLSS